MRSMMPGWFEAPHQGITVGNPIFFATVFCKLMIYREFYFRGNGLGLLKIKNYVSINLYVYRNVH